MHWPTMLASGTQRQALADDAGQWHTSVALAGWANQWYTTVARAGLAGEWHTTSAIAV